MKKRLSVLIIAILLVVFAICCTAATANASSPFIPTEGLNISKFIDISTDMEYLMHRQDIAHDMADCARALGYEENHPAILAAKSEWDTCEKKIKENVDLAFYWETKFEEYPYATYIWLFLTKGLGYSDAVAAGILGNIMAEVGANTLNIQYWLYSYGNGYYYGICQWAKNYFPEVRGMDLIDQCEYLAKNINTQIDAFGVAYNTQNAYNKFLESESCRDAALMFAKWYEACDASTYSIRQNNADKAYEYFVMGLN